MQFYAFIPRADGSAPCGTQNQIIIRDLKTVRGAIKRLNNFSTWKGKPFKLFTFSNLYDDNTHKLVYTNPKKIII